MALTDEAILRIKEMILGGQLKPGDRLPREADLAETLGLSRNSLREAVRALALINILDVRQGDGTYVTSLDPHLLLDTLTFVVDFHRDDSVLDFLRVRRILEPAAAAMAAQLVTPDQVRQMQEVVDASRLDATPEDLLTSDIEFHRLVSSASGNSVLASLIEGLSGPTNRARVWRGRTQAGAQERTVREHQAILDALALESAAVLGSSSGGYVAQQLAVMQPERVDALILVGSPLTLQGRPAFADEVDALADPLDEDWVRQSLLWFPLGQAVPGWYLDDRVADGLKMPAHVWKSVLAGLCLAAPPTETGTIHAPTLILWGEEDGLLPRSQQELLAARIPGSVLKTYAGTGHVVLWECPERVAADTRAFLAKL